MSSVIHIKNQRACQDYCLRKPAVSFFNGSDRTLLKYTLLYAGMIFYHKMKLLQNYY